MLAAVVKNSNFMIFNGVKEKTFFLSFECRQSIKYSKHFILIDVSISECSVGVKQICSKENQFFIGNQAKFIKSDTKREFRNGILFVLLSQLSFPNKSQIRM